MVPDRPAESYHGFGERAYHAPWSLRGFRVLGCSLSSLSERIGSVSGFDFKMLAFTSRSLDIDPGTGSTSTPPTNPG